MKALNIECFERKEDTSMKKAIFIIAAIVMLAIIASLFLMSNNIKFIIAIVALAIITLLVTKLVKFIIKLRNTNRYTEDDDNQFYSNFGQDDDESSYDKVRIPCRKNPHAR